MQNGRGTVLIGKVTGILGAGALVRVLDVCVKRNGCAVP